MALGTQNSGPSEPSPAYAYMVWADTTTGQLKVRNAANTAWVAHLDLATGSLLTSAATAAKLSNSVTISLNGVVSGNAQFSGAASVTITTGSIKGFQQWEALNVVCNNNYLDISAQGATVVTSAGYAINISSVALNKTVSVGVTSIDTGAVITSATGYYYYVIYNPTTTATQIIFSQNYQISTKPTPLLANYPGFTHFIRAGHLYVTGSSTPYSSVPVVARFNKIDKNVVFSLESGSPLPLLVSSTAPQWTAVAVYGLLNYVPYTALVARLLPQWSSGVMEFAPYAGYSSPGLIHLASSVSMSPVGMVLDHTGNYSEYYSTGAGNKIWIYGYNDNL